MKYYLGVDGGGTRTTAAVCGEDGKIIRTVTGASVNYYSNSMETARNAFCEIIEKTGIRDYASVCIGMSALSEEADSRTARAFTDGILTADKLVMTSDTAVALAAAPCEGERAVVICGTGSMAAAVTKSGKVIHRGGWGYLLGDGGSAYAIALDAVKSAVKDFESGGNDLLTKKFLSFFGVSTEDEILERFYDPPVRRDELAAFCPEVFSAFEGKSPLAAAVISAQAREAAELIKSIRPELSEDAPVFLYGGLFEHQPGYAGLVNDRAGIQARLLTRPPVFGALKTALKADGITVPVTEIHE